MSAVQAGITDHRFDTELQKERYARQQLEARFAEMEKSERKARYERDLTALLGMGYEFTLSKEVQRMEPTRYDDAACAAQLACIKENYQRAPVGGGDDPFVQTITLPNGGMQETKVTYEENKRAKKYAMDHNIGFDEALIKIRGA